MESAVKTFNDGRLANTGRLPSFLKTITRPPRRVSDALYMLTHWETWDWRIKYLVIAPAWFWCCLRARSLWFFTAANPTLTFGGFDGERKQDMYRHLPPGTYPRSIYVSRGMDFASVADALKDTITFPLAVKPDVGKMGFMFRALNSTEELKTYHLRADFDYIIQELIDYPLEVSVFYYRFPDEASGHITGFVKKEHMQVTGDGKSTLRELIANCSRARFRQEEMYAKHVDQLHRVLRQGEVYALSQALNLSRGGKLVSLEHEKDERLLNVFDGLSHDAGFYFGRYDIRCESVESLKQGKNFSILEFNGSGAEPHHVYGNAYTFWQACRILVWHWNILCRISRMNARRGVDYWDFIRGWRFFRECVKHSAKLERLDCRTPET